MIGLNLFNRILTLRKDAAKHVLVNVNLNIKLSKRNKKRRRKEEESRPNGEREAIKTDF